MEFASHLRIGTVVESHLRPHPGSIQLGDNGDVNVAEDDDSDSDESADRVAVSFPKENQTQLQTRVSSIASILGISKLLDRSVGQMSGGEKKRVSIGVEMLINRPLVVIDEGTTGLDSFQALLLIRALRRQATYDLSTVIITLHQPSYEMFHMCDQLLLFGPDGRLAFTGSPRNLTMFLSKLGHACAEFENPVDFAVELMSVLSKSELDDMVAFNQQIQGLENLDTVEYVKRQDEPHVAIDAAQAMSDFLQVDVTSPSEQDASIPPPFIRRRTKQFASSAEIATTIYYDAGIVTEMGALSRRSCRRCIRSPMMFRVRLLSTCLILIFTFLLMHLLKL
jgi:ABC-type multidrug transport system ATPase subunit